MTQLKNKTMTVINLGFSLFVVLIAVSVAGLIMFVLLPWFWEV